MPNSTTSAWLSCMSELLETWSPCQSAKILGSMLLGKRSLAPEAHVNEAHVCSFRLSGKLG